MSIKSKTLVIARVLILSVVSVITSYAQSSLQVGIIPHVDNNRFCEDNPETFVLEANPDGGSEPYHYEWTFSWNDDTLRDRIITFYTDTPGVVTLTVYDNSRPAKSKYVTYNIHEIVIDADFSFSPDSMCAQNPVYFFPEVTGGTPGYQYFWDFNDGSNSNSENPAHEYIASGCTGFSSFDVHLRVYDSDGCYTTVNKTVHVKNKPFLDFDDSENPYSPFKHCHPPGTDPTFDVVLVNNSLNTSCITSYEISWGDGDVENVTSLPIRHTYTTAGAFELGIHAENSTECDLSWSTYVYNQSTPAAGLESYGGTEGCAPIEFSFGLIGYETNSIGTTYTWDFGDGSPPVVWEYADPYVNDTITHTYNRTSCIYGGPDGDYTTVVTVNNGCGEVQAKVTGVMVWKKPCASIDDGNLTIDTICVDETIQLINNSTTGYYGTDCSPYSEYMWDFGDGTTSENDVMPPKSWSEPGKYDIILDMRNLCGISRDTFKILVIEPPVANVLVEDTAGCAPFIPQFENNSTGEAVEYLWDITPSSGFTFLNGTSDTSREPEISFNLGGSYRVVSYISNPCQTDSVVFNITVFTEPDGRIENLNNVCITDPVIHPTAVYNNNGRPVNSFSWNFPGSSSAFAFTEDPGEHTYVSAGEYSVHLTLGNECGNANLSDTFYVYPAPEITVITPASICESNSFDITGSTSTNVTSFEWKTLGDGYFNDNRLLNPVYHPGSNDINNSGTDLHVVAKGESPCTADTAVINLAIQKEPWVNVDEDVTICEGNSYTIMHTTAENYDVLQWTTSGDGYFSDPSMLLPVYYPGENDLVTGYAELTLTAHGIEPCSFTTSDRFLITYAGYPTIDAGPDQDICENGQVSLQATGTGFVSVNWQVEPGEGTFSNPTSLTPVFTLDPGFSGNLVILTIEATGSYGCPNVYDTIELSVIPRPTVFAGDDGVVCESGSYEVEDAAVQESSDYYWRVNGDGTLNDNSFLNPEYFPGTSDIERGWVTLTLTAEGNSVCPDVSDEVTIHIQKLPVSNAGEDQLVCKSDDYTTTGNQMNGASYLWTSLGTGSFEDATGLNTTYYPSENDQDTGYVELVLRVNAMTPCTLADYDTVRLTFIDPPVVSAGNDTTICSSSFAPLHAYAINATQYEWSSNGSGTWYHENTLNPTYFPSASDITNGSVILTLTATNPVCPPVSDDILLTLIPFPVSDAGSDDVICEDNVKHLDDSYSENYSSLEWRSSGDGNFDDVASVHPFYYPGENDIDNGIVDLYLVATGIPPCNTPEIDTMTLSIQKNPMVFTGADTIIGEGEVFKAIHATAHNISHVLWKTLGDGTFLNNTVIESTYTPGENDIMNKGVSLVLEGMSISPCVTSVTDTIFILITPKPVANAGLDEMICEGSSVTISSASAEDYSEIWWTTTGSGILNNDSTLNPTYHPSDNDIEGRTVSLVLHARGIYPIENTTDRDHMLINITHNAMTNVILSDTACENYSYLIDNIVYQDVNTITWSSSGDGYFNGTGEKYPVYHFSSNDKDLDTIFFYVQANSLSPCVHIDHDTLMLRLYHEPEPSFVCDNQEGCSPLPVHFTNTSTGEELTYQWDFGNGLKSDEEDPGEILFQQGRIADTIYTVTLEATNRCNSSSTSLDVIVKPLPIADFGMNVSWGCSPEEIYFSNVSTGLPDTHLWKWGDGKEPSMEENPASHIFETGDYDTTYTITLITENECGLDSMQKSVIIFPNTVDAFFETDTTFGCAPLEVSFTNYSRGVLGDEPFLNWSWNFGDGNITDELHPVHTFENPGTYEVSLYVNDTCSYDTSTTVIDVMGAPHVEFATDKIDYCEHDTVNVSPFNMSIDEIGSVIWDFGDGTRGYNFTDNHIYDTAGEYTITFTAKDIVNGCTSSISKDITVYKAPAAAFSIPENDGCQPLHITFLNETEGGDYYSWDFGNGNKSNDIDGQQLFTEAGIYNIILKARNVRGCTDTAIKTLNVYPRPKAAFESSSYQTCFPPVDIKFINLSEGADAYQWDFGNGVVSKETNPSITYSDYGEYSIKLIANNMFFCSDTSEMIFHVFHNPVADFKVDTTIGCDPFIVPFTNLSEYGVEYFWNFEDQGYSEEEEPAFTFNGEGVYTVTLKVIGQGGCVDSVIKEDFITTNPSPISDFDYSRVDEIDTIYFHNYSSGAIAYIWDFGDGEFSEEENPWHSYKHYGKYSVSLTTINEYDCKDIKTDSINFELIKGLFLPDALSPGNISEDIGNFKAVGIGLKKYHLLIYDTWGNLIWETTELYRGMPAEAWDGTFNGKPLDPDVYVWHLKEATFKDGSEYKGERYGTITLIR